MENNFAFVGVSAISLLVNFIILFFFKSPTSSLSSSSSPPFLSETISLVSSSWPGSYSASQADLKLPTSAFPLMGLQMCITTVNSMRVAMYIPVVTNPLIQMLHKGWQVSWCLLSTWSPGDAGWRDPHFSHSFPSGCLQQCLSSKQTYWWQQQGPKRKFRTSLSSCRVCHVLPISPGAKQVSRSKSSWVWRHGSSTGCSMTVSVAEHFEATLFYLWQNAKHSSADPLLSATAGIKY